ncbi:MAG: energy transducer TonB [Candidatus Kryptoniota bacterium]
MSGLSLLNEQRGSVAGSFYFRQYEIRHLYSRNFFRGLFLSIILHALFIGLLILYAPIYHQPPEVERIIMPVESNIKIIEIQLTNGKKGGMDYAGSGGGQGTMPGKAGAAFGKPKLTGNSSSTLTPNASVVPRSLQGPGINDIAGISRPPVYFDSLSGYSGSALSGEGAGGGEGTGIGNRMGNGAGFTGKPGFGGGIGNKFLPGNPLNNSAGGTPYEIAWNGVSRAILRGERPVFPAGVEHGGTVKIKIVVDPDGNVKSMVPVEKADSRLEEAAMAAIRTWKFSKLPSGYAKVDQSAVAKFIFKVD